MSMQGLCNFVDTGKEPITSVEGLTEALGKLEGEERIGSQGIQLYDTDHVIGPKGMTISTLQAHQKANRSAVAVLYGAVGTPGFKELHDTLVQSASSGEPSPSSLLASHDTCKPAAEHHKHLMLCPPGNEDISAMNKTC